MPAKKFEELEIWKQARHLTGEIYRMTRSGLFAKDYSLANQIQRASVSVMSNIAEGFERGGNKELFQYLSIAKGSCGEVRCQLYVALDQEYITKSEADKLIDQHRKLSIMLHKFMEHLKGSKFDGPKYRPAKPDPEMAEFDQMLKGYLEK